MAHRYMKEVTERIIKRIIAQHPVSYEKLEALALGAGYDITVFEQAMERVHRDSRIKQVVRGDSLEYTLAMVKPKPEPFVSTIPYPPMDETNNADHPTFADLDYSYLFLTPEELDKYKAQVRGVAYIPKKRYQRSVTPTEELHGS